MGWVCMQMHRSFDERKEIEHLFTWSETAPFHAELVYLTKVGTTWYGAVKKTPKPGQDPYQFSYGHEPDPEDGSITFAFVILTRKGQGEFCYKDMDESMGPNEAKAPLKLINMLSPTDREYALKWRERCRAYARRPKPKIGDIVRLHEPWEPYGDLFEKIEWPRARGIYRSCKTGQPVRLRTTEIKEIVT